MFCRAKPFFLDRSGYRNCSMTENTGHTAYVTANRKNKNKIIFTVLLLKFSLLVAQV